MSELKEVYYGEYCKRCEHWAKPESEYPCDECMDEPFRYNSHMPAYFKDRGSDITAKEKKKSRKKRRL